MEIHRPVLVKEICENIALDKINLIIDATIGLGGHAKNFLKFTKARLIGLDLDNESLKIAEENLKEFKERVKLIEINYRYIKDVVKNLGLEGIDLICADLGISSYQLNYERRGFSFLEDAKLDMRFSDKNEVNAMELLNNSSIEELEWIFRVYGEEPMAKSIADEVVNQRRNRKIESTVELVNIVRKIKGKGSRRHNPATLVFQALRIAVNDELMNLRIFLQEGFKVLSIGGYMVIISYHSVEDRIVKNIFKLYSLSCRCRLTECRCEGKPLARLINKKVIRPSREEILRNRSSRSAKLRIIQKIDEIRFPEYLDNFDIGRHKFNPFRRRFTYDNKDDRCCIY